MTQPNNEFIPGGEGVWEGPSGARYHYHKHKLHRLDGPAIEHSTGSGSWLVSGYQHREDGPAFVAAWSGYEEYWVNGTRVSKADYPAALARWRSEGGVVTGPGEAEEDAGYPCERCGECVEDDRELDSYGYCEECVRSDLMY